MEEKSEHFVYDFITQYAPKNDKTILGKIFNRMKKRDSKALIKSGYKLEDPASDFDF